MTPELKKAIRACETVIAKQAKPNFTGRRFATENRIRGYSATINK